MANALNRQEGLSPSAFTPAIVRRDAFGQRRAFDVLVAEAEGHVVGYASFLAAYNSDIAALAMWMLDLFVLPGCRSRGAGHALVAAVARETQRRGLLRLEWGVRGKNVRARRFYRRLGARVSDTRIASLQGRALGALGWSPLARSPAADRQARLSRLAAEGVITLPSRKLLRKVRTVKTSGLPVSQAILGDRR